MNAGPAVSFPTTTGPTRSDSVVCQWTTLAQSAHRRRAGHTVAVVGLGRWSDAWSPWLWLAWPDHAASLVRADPGLGWRAVSRPSVGPQSSSARAWHSGHLHCPEVRPEG